MKRFLFVLAGTVAGIIVVSSALALEVPLKYERFPDNARSFMPSGAVMVENRTMKPPGELKLPELKSNYPLYSLAKIGDSERLLVLDFKAEGDPFYNRLYFDSNGNNDLTDDKAVDGNTESPGQNYYYVSFPAVDAMIEVDGVSLPYSFRLEVSGQMTSGSGSQSAGAQNTRRSVSVILISNCAYSATFQAGGRQYRAMLGDSNANGRFDERLTMPPFMQSPMQVRQRIYATGDQLFLTGGDGAFDYSDSQLLGDFLLVNGKLFEIALSIAKLTLTLTEVTAGLAEVKIPMEVERLSLYTDDGKNCVNIYRPGAAVMIPAGTYKLLSYQVFHKDEQGDAWRVCASGTTSSPTVTAAQNSGSTLELGEPFTPVVDVHSSGGNSQSGNSQTPLNFSIEGIGKELLTDVSHVSGDLSKIPLSKTRGRETRPEEPAYKIIKSDGEIVATGSFEYG